MDNPTIFRRVKNSQYTNQAVWPYSIQCISVGRIWAVVVRFKSGPIKNQTKYIVLTILPIPLHHTVFFVDVVLWLATTDRIHKWHGG